MIEVRLPSDMMPSRCDDLIRLGRDHDGGYLVSAADVHAAECLIGLGLNDDWSFEEGFNLLNDCDLVVYDGSVGLLEFLKRAVRAPWRKGRKGNIAYQLAVLASYLQFFRGRRLHLPVFVARSPGPRNVSFDDVVARLGGRRAFLKIDIEGAEYGILDGIIALRPQLTGLVIEFHDCDRRLKDVRRFVRKVGLTLVHVHANNYAQIAADGTPKVIELTFSASTPRTLGPLSPLLPNELDRPNHPRRAELAIRFDDPPGPQDDYRNDAPTGKRGLA